MFHHNCLRYLGAAVLVLLLAVTAWGQNQSFSFEFDPAVLTPTPSGPRAAGMGRAHTAIADDAYAIGWNPAGLAQVDQNLAAIAGTVTFGNFNLEMPSNMTLLYDREASQGSTASLNFIGFTIPIPVADPSYNLVSSIAIRNVADFADEYSFSTIQQSQEIFSDEIMATEGGLFSLAGGIAMNILPSVQLGASVNFLSGRYKYKQTTRYFDEAIDDRFEEYSNKFSGFHFDVGFLWHVSQNLTLGSRLSTPHRIHYNQVEQTDSNDNSYQFDADFQLEKPLSVSYGLALTMADNVTFAFDYVQRPWNKIKAVRDTEEVDRVFANANSFHMGIEYVLKSDHINVPWRLGFFNNPEQKYEYTETIGKQGDQVSSHFITGGLGIYTRQFALDASIAYQILQYQTDFNQHDIYDKGNDLLPLPVEFNRSKILVTVGLQIIL